MSDEVSVAVRDYENGVYLIYDVFLIDT